MRNLNLNVFSIHKSTKSVGVIVLTYKVHRNILMCKYLLFFLASPIYDLSLKDAKSQGVVKRDNGSGSSSFASAFRSCML